jgi:hypothetical protein
MATIVKLTYTLNGKATLLNLEKMTTAFRIFEKSTRKYATRINFENDSFVIVDEELQEIKQLHESNLAGEYQDNDWVEVDAGEGTEFHERLENNYHSNYQPQNGYNGNRRPRQYQNNYNNRY